MTASDGIITKGTDGGIYHESFQNVRKKDRSMAPQL